MKTILQFCLASLLVVSCSKKDEKNNTTPFVTENFTINGITDADLYATMNLNIALKDGGKQETVNLELSGLPSGASGVFSNTSGIPTFESKLGFKTFNTKAGTYPVKLIGKSASTTKEYSFKLSVPELYGIFVENSDTYTPHLVQNQIADGASRINITSYSSGGIELDITLPAGSMNTPGTYTYNISDKAGPGTAVVSMSGAKFLISTADNTEKVTFTIASPDYTGQNKIVSIDMEPINVATDKGAGKLYIRYSYF